MPSYFGMSSPILPFVLFFLLSISFEVQATVSKRSTGALTPLSSKSTRCSVLDYGGVADGKTDVGPAISKAFSDCASEGGATLVVPAGNYSCKHPLCIYLGQVANYGTVATGVTLSGGSAWAFQLDGLLTLTGDGDFDGNAIVIEKTSDIEFFSSNGLGAVSGNLQA